MSDFVFPEMPLAEWRETRDTIRGYAQVLGKIRRALDAPQKYWWHVSLQITAVGLTTTPLFCNGQLFEVVIDFTDHQTHIVSSTGGRRAISMREQSPAMYCQQVKLALAEMGLTVDFDEGVCVGEAVGMYDETAVSRFWHAFAQITAVFTTFKHSFRGESSPLQLWPHHFDLALLWLSGRLVPDQDPDDPESADEQMNFGFVTGDESIADPYFYVTAYPTPASFAQQPLPTAAYWQTEGWTGAILPYAALTTVGNPEVLLLDFLRMAHEAGGMG